MSVVDDLELLLEHVHPLLHRQEREAVRGVLDLRPARAEPELDPPAGDVIGGRGQLGQHGRVPERRRGDHRPQPQRRRARGESADRAPRVERAALAFAHH
jgi:hypothetical protein